MAPLTSSTLHERDDRGRPSGRTVRRLRRHGLQLLSILVSASIGLPSTIAKPLEEKDEQDEELAAELPRIPPTEAQDALETFRVHPDFELELVASEPQVIDPVALAFDERERFYVAEMRDYPFTHAPGTLTTDERAHGQPTGRVRRLADSNGDGVVDESHVFLDGLTWPTAIACSKGGVYVAAAPHLYYARDVDDDGVADERRVVFRGFGRRNVQSLVCGLKWGVDQSLYVLGGSNGGTIRSVVTGEDTVLRGQDFRFRPDTEAMELLAPSGGQFGLAFDAAGRRFVCSNSQHIVQVIVDDRAFDHSPRTSGIRTSKTIAVDGGAAPVFRASPAEPWRVVRTRWRKNSDRASRYPNTELVPIGFFTSATGILVYRSEAYGDEYRGNIFVGDVGGNLVHRKRLDTSGVEFRATRPDPDESREFLTSTDNWFRPVHLVEGPRGAIYILDMYRETIEHPASLPDRLQRHLHLTSGNDRGRIYRLTRRRGSARRPDTTVRSSSLDAVDALDSASAWERTTAARLLSERGTAELVAPLQRHVASGRRAEGRLLAQWLLDSMGTLDSATLAAALADNDAGARENAIRIVHRRAMAGREVDLDDSAWKALAVAAAGDAPRVKFRAALFAAQSDHPRASEVLRRAGEGRLDPWVARALLSGSIDRSLSLLEGTLESLDGEGDPPSWFPDAVAAIASAGIDPAARWLRRIVSHGDARVSLSLAALLDDKLARHGRSLRGLDVDLAELDARARRFAGTAPEVPGETPLDGPARVAAISVLGTLPRVDPLVAAALDARRSLEVQLAALGALDRVGTLRSTELVVERFGSFSPRVRDAASEWILRSADRTTALLRAVDATDLEAGNLGSELARRLREHPDSATRTLAARVLGNLTSSSRQKVLERYAGAARREGQTANGRAIHERVCASCHRGRGIGHAVAPDLETVAVKSAPELLVAILDPNREVASAYVGYTAVTRRGTVHSGLLSHESSTSVTLRRAEGLEETLNRRDLTTFESSGRSLMPEGLEESLSPSDVADLIAWIRGLADPPTRAPNKRRSAAKKR